MTVHGAKQLGSSDVQARRVMQGLHETAAATASVGPTRLLELLPSTMPVSCRPGR
jgi:hypothetical protein